MCCTRGVCYSYANSNSLKQDCVFLGSCLRVCLSADFLNDLVSGLANCSYWCQMSSGMRSEEGPYAVSDRSEIRPYQC